MARMLHLRGFALLRPLCGPVEQLEPEDFPVEGELPTCPACILIAEDSGECRVAGAAIAASEVSAGWVARLRGAG